MPIRIGAPRNSPAHRSLAQVGYLSPPPRPAPPPPPGAGGGRAIGSFFNAQRKPAGEKFLELIGVERLVAMPQRGAEDAAAAVVVGPDQWIRHAIFRAHRGRQRLGVRPHLLDHIELVDGRDERRQPGGDRIAVGPLEQDVVGARMPAAGHANQLPPGIVGHHAVRVQGAVEEHPGHGRPRDVLHESARADRRPPSTRCG